MKFLSIFISIILLLIPPASAETSRQIFFEEEPCPLSVILPAGWAVFPGAQERWMGNDPTVAFNHPNQDGVQVTYYGLDSSRFHSAEEFLQYIKRVINPSESEKGILIGGRQATILQFRYSYEKHSDIHGTNVPGERVFEEFVIVPLERGFYAFAITLRSTTPNSLVESSQAIQYEIENNQRKLRQWYEFLDSVQFPQTNP